jgi:hypothetical protein
LPIGIFDSLSVESFTLDKFNSESLSLLAAGAKTCAADSKQLQNSVVCAGKKILQKFPTFSRF